MARRYTLKTHLPERTFRIAYESELNPEQLAVVEAGQGALLVIAGAGSGKTRTLTYRVARLIESGVPANEILLLTFTNRAAREMVGRVQALVGEGLGRDLRRLWGGTFHSVANLTLREFGARLGYGERFAILDREDAGELMKSCIAELKMGERGRRFPKGDVLVKIVSTAVNTQTPIADVVADAYPHFASLTEEILEVAAHYMRRKRELDAMDFDDLLLNWKVLLVEHPEVRAAQAGRFRHILVDEYQDTNRLQGDIVDLLASVHPPAGTGSVMVVGDDAQSIYSFRGAHFANIFEFPKRHPECRIFHLTANYRSTPEILRLANVAIAHNDKQFEKALRPTRKEGMLPALVPCRDVYQQAEFVCQRLLEMRDEGIDLKDIAILYRAHHHSLELQVELSRRNIPFIVRSGLRFFEQAHIKDVLCYLRFVVNPRDELAFKRTVKLHPGIGAGLADALWRLATGEASAGKDPLERLLSSRAFEVVGRRGARGLGAWQALVRRLAPPTLWTAPGEMIRLVLEHGYEATLREAFTNAESRIEDIEQLADFAASYEDVDAFLQEVSLLAELEGEEVIDGGDPDEYVTLSTIHKAKGLEWRGVFVIWLADGRFPVSAAYRSLESLEEERRLFYVACTRARDELYLTYPLTHSSRDRERTVLKASPFLQELAEAEEEAPVYEKWLLEGEGADAAAPAAIEAGRVPDLLGRGRDEEL
ncbi:MAG: ATP-dependent helicase [Deltaproteobacteria bacterium]|nr:MAG: ATP-dependent helicase [Deltaproteobacteria bacterium]